MHAAFAADLDGVLRDVRDMLIDKTCNVIEHQKKLEAV